MPGPKMGPRPVDFDEDVIKQSPTFGKWQALQSGQKLRYACREFIKDHGDDEERLMRRIMIARRNNIRDHETLKRARRTVKSSTGSVTQEDASTRRRRPPSSFSDAQVEREMDVPAVEATRSYRSWQLLPEGAEFVYNQKYIKGREGHDWLLRKNIWRRMRYRRENKKMVETLKEHTAGPMLPTVADVMAQGVPKTEEQQQPSNSEAAAAAAAAATASLADQAAVEAAVAAAVSFGKTTANSLDHHMGVHNPLVNNESNNAAVAQAAALEAAAKLAAATSSSAGLDEEDEDALLKAEIGQAEGV